MDAQESTILKVKSKLDSDSLDVDKVGGKMLQNLTSSFVEVLHCLHSGVLYLGF